MIEVDAIAERHVLLRVVLLGDLVHRVQQQNDVVGERCVEFRDFLRERHRLHVGGIVVDDLTL